MSVQAISRTSGRSEKIKPDLRRVTLNQLEELTGKTHRTIKKRLAESGVEYCHTDGNAKFYNPKDALPAIFIAGAAPSMELDENGEPVTLNPINEKALLDRARRTKIELEIAVIRKTLLPADQLSTILTDALTSIRQKQLSLPHRLAKRLAEVSEEKAIEEILRKELSDSLDALSKADPSMITPLAGTDNGEGEDE